MPRKGMRSVFFPKSPSSLSSSPSDSLHSRPLTPILPFLELKMDEDLLNAEKMIQKWNPDSSTYAKITSLWHENRKEAKDFLKCVRDLQRVMQYLVSADSSSSKLVGAQSLMQIAMKRLEKEFYQILAANRDHLDPESVSGPSSRASARSSTSDYDDNSDDEQSYLQIAGESISEVERVSSLAMSDLRAIAECMISSGYGKECVKIYKIIRKSIVDEGLYRVGIERLSFSQIQKMDWGILEMKIKTWLSAVKIAVRTLFTGERILCDHVFAASDSVRESCFSEISKEGALQLFNFPETVAKSKKSPEKMFRILDLYAALSELWPELELIFSYESCSNVRSHALNSMMKLGELARIMLTDFETAIQKDSSKNRVPGGGLHPLSRYVMNYICFLADYHEILADITADWPLQVQNVLPEDYYSENSDENPASSVSVRLAWLILVLLCKLDGKADLYKDVSLSYFFLMNNLNYIVGKVRSSGLRSLLGEEWIEKHAGKMKQYAGNYERMAWNKVLAMLQNTPPEINRETAKDFFRRFNSAFEEACKAQSSLVMPDSKLRDELKLSIAQKLVPAYIPIYERFRGFFQRDSNLEVFIRFSPEDLRNHLSNLFNGMTSGSVNGSSSSYSGHSHASR